MTTNARPWMRKQKQLQACNKTRANFAGKSLSLPATAGAVSATHSSGEILSATPLFTSCPSLALGRFFIRYERSCSLKIKKNDGFPPQKQGVTLRNFSGFFHPRLVALVGRGSCAIACGGWQNLNTEPRKTS